MKSETVEVISKTIAYDDDMDETISSSSVMVQNVLFGQPSTADVISADREHGLTVQYVCAFPKEFVGSLRGCAVKRTNGEIYKVIGDPKPLDYNCPTPWNREVMLGGNDG